ncbi:hypothetical protein NECID01_2086, partial [Nematocida sp. AWRm77]
DLETKKHKALLIWLGIGLIGLCALLTIYACREKETLLPGILDQDTETLSGDRLSARNFLRAKRAAKDYGRYHKYTKDTLPAGMIDLGVYSRYHKHCYMAAEPFEYFCVWDDVDGPYSVKYRFDGFFLFRWSLDDLIKGINNPKFVLKLQEFLKMHNIDRDISEYLPKTP